MSWSATNSIKVGTKTSLSIPGVGSEELSFEYSFALTAGSSTGITRSFSEYCSAPMPPNSCFKCSMIVEVSKAHIKVGAGYARCLLLSCACMVLGGACCTGSSEGAQQPRGRPQCPCRPSRPLTPVHALLPTRPRQTPPLPACNLLSRPAPCAQIPMTMALSGGVGLHHDPAIRNVPGDGDG